MTIRASHHSIHKANHYRLLTFLLKDCINEVGSRLRISGGTPCEGSRTTDSPASEPLALDTQEFQSHRIER